MTADSVRMARVYLERRARGVCVACQVPVENTARCASCASRSRASVRRLHDTRRAAGLCRNCALPSTKATCEECNSVRRLKTNAKELA